VAAVPSECYRNSTCCTVFELTFAYSPNGPSWGQMPMYVVVSYGKGKTDCLHTIMAYRGMEVCSAHS